jgi:hypothetical protein
MSRQQTALAVNCRLYERRNSNDDRGGAPFAWIASLIPTFIASQPFRTPFCSIRSGSWCFIPFSALIKPFATCRKHTADKGRTYTSTCASWAASAADVRATPNPYTRRWLGYAGCFKESCRLLEFGQERQAEKEFLTADFPVRGPFQ